MRGITIVAGWRLPNPQLTTARAYDGGVADEPSISASLRNFREYDAPLATKLRLLYAANRG